jgi:hypothetical protein
MDPRDAVRGSLRLHPRVIYQALVGEAGALALADALPPLLPFGGRRYEGAIAILDWDHRLPSRTLLLRLYAYTSTASLALGEQAYVRRLEEIGRRDRFPEFDVPDFEGLQADESYEGEVSPTGELDRLRLVSSWRRDIGELDAETAVQIVRASAEFRRVREEAAGRPAHLGDLEAVGWCPPCESDLEGWTLDVWYLTSFDGQIGRGKSLLVDASSHQVLSVRDFMVRAG